METKTNFSNSVLRDFLNEAETLEERLKKNDSIKCLSILYEVKPVNNPTTRYLVRTKSTIDSTNYIYTFVINKITDYDGNFETFIVLQSTGYINEEPVALTYARNKLGDFSIDGQSEIFEDFDIKPIEKAIKAYTGYSIKLYKSLDTFNGEPTMSIYSDDLQLQTGIFTKSLNLVQLQSNNIHFIIDRDTKQMRFSNMSFYYRVSYTSGGANSVDCMTITYNVRTKQYTAHIAPSKTIDFYNGETNQYSNLEQLL